jgi:hypothetical protein
VVRIEPDWLHRVQDRKARSTIDQVASNKM